MPSFNRNIILAEGRNGWLSDDEIDHFAYLLHRQFEYDIVESWTFQIPEWSHAIEPTKKHIQLLHSMAGRFTDNDAGSMRGGHWICTYFDTNILYVYDSANSRYLHESHKQALKILYPSFSFEKSLIKFCQVQNQTNGYDCGVFAIAFAVSLAFGDNPEKITYDVANMRKHLLHMFESNMISKFPVTTTSFESRKVSNSQQAIPSMHRKKGEFQFTEPDEMKKNIANDNDKNIKSTRNMYRDTVWEKQSSSEKRNVLKEMRSDSKNNVQSRRESKIESREHMSNETLKTAQQNSNIPREKPTKTTRLLPFSKHWLDIIDRNEQLQDEHINYFGAILGQFSDYQHQDPLFLQRPDRIISIPPAKKHIQILYSSGDKKNDSGHWICSFYDARYIYIYDSMNMRTLHKDHLTFLNHLYPFYNVTNSSVRFLKVQQQNNCVDCGVFAIAFAVSLLFLQKPELINYNVALIRKHLKILFQTCELSPFPVVSNTNSIRDLSLEKLRYNELRAYQQRINRDKKMNLGSSTYRVDQITEDIVDENFINGRKTGTSSPRYSSNKNNNIDDLQKAMNNQMCSEGDVSKKTTMNINDRSTTNVPKKAEFNTRKAALNTGSTNRPIKRKRSALKETIANKKLKTESKQETISMKFRSDDRKAEINCPRYSPDRNQMCSPRDSSNKTDMNTNDQFTANVPQKAESHINKATLNAGSTNRPIKRKRPALKKTIVDKKLKTESKQETIPMKFRSDECINKLTSIISIEDGTIPAESKLEADKIMKWCMEQRKSYVRILNRLSTTLRENADKFLTRVKCSKGDKAINLCGKSRHTISSESYFYETIYSFEELKNHVISMNSKGQAMDVLPLSINNKHRKIWSCSIYCQEVRNDKVLHSYQKFLESLAVQKLSTFPKFLDGCFIKHSEDKLGHLSHCYMEQNPCTFSTAAVEMLAPHFPNVRNIKRQLYKIRQIFRELEDLDAALESVDLKILRRISNNMKSRGELFDTTGTSTDHLDEDKIQIKHKDAFLALNKRSMDVAEHHCISCQKLHSRRSLREIKSLRKGIESQFWKDLLQYVKDHEVESSEYVCSYCLEKFRANQLPAVCILNAMSIGNVPTEIRTLNYYEKILIQRAKVFQVIQRAGTVQKKNIPHSMRVQKLVGQSFHLYLPMEETLKKIASTTDPINKNHELYILIRGLPTKGKVVWENMVNLKKVFSALKWLQCNNPLYSKIVLPESAEKLMDWLLENEVEYKVEPEENKDIDNEDEYEVNSDPDGDFNEKNDGESIRVGENVSTLNPKAENEREIDDEVEIPSNSLNKNRLDQSAMVTQIDEHAPRFEEYSIFPMYDKRVNETACNLYQMKKVRDKPLNFNMETLDLLCFPDLYPYGINAQHETRNTNLTDFEYIKARLCSKDPRFRLNQQYLFYLLNNANFRQINSGIYHTLNVTNSREKYTAKSYMEHIRNGELERNMNTVFERLRNTEQYWNKPRNNLFCMARYYGPATWFLTLSPAEWNWKELVTHIRKINAPHMDKLSDGEAVAADPVSVSRFIDNKFHAMLDFLTSDSEPIGKIKHYFWRREYQGRGVQHFHLVIWIEDAPIVGINSNEEVANFIMKYVTCAMPNAKISPNLHRRVMNYQTHKHNSYCLRSKKHKSGEATMKCRFGFPRPVTKEFVLRDVAASIAGRRQLKTKSRFYDLPRTENEMNINDYNPVILSAWEGNMDIQFIGESSSIITQYITKYAMKTEPAKKSVVITEATSTKTGAQKLWNIGMRGLRNRELGALEAADTLLGISLYGTDPDTTFKWLDVRMLRNRKVKKYQEVMEMNEESTDIFCPSLIDDYYPQRPKELESMCLYEFCKWYDIVRTEPKIEGVEYYTLKPSLFLKRRSRGYLINHWRYNVVTEPENFFYSLLLLFKPWRNTDQLKGECQSYTEAFEHDKGNLANACEYHKHLEDFQRGLDYITKQVLEELNKNDTGTHIASPGIQIGCDPKEGKAAMQEFKEMEKRIAQDTDLDSMISQMNADQRRIFEEITRTITSENRILRSYISGEGGTGKSFLIEVIRTWISKEMKRKTAVTAPTGIAAFNINGLTIHRYFQLPVEHDDNTKYKQLSDNLLKLMREEMRDVELIIIDEISMVSNLTLLYINLRLMEIFDTIDEPDGWFGKKHIILFGDLLQLPPVRQDPPYVKLSASAIEKKLGTMISINLWEDLFSYDELTINMRQQKDKAYGDLLSRMRIGAMTSNDLKLLESRKLDIRAPKMADRLYLLTQYIKNLPMNTVCLFATRHQCDCLNTIMLEQIYSDEVILTAEDSVDCYNARLKKKASKFFDRMENDDRSSAGLSKVIIIKIGAKIMLRRNIDVTIGLVNGTIGTVVSISKSIEKATEYIKSIHIRLECGREYDIERVDVKFEIMDGAYVIRRQFPICLSYGITIHKAQGLSLIAVVIDVGNSIFTSGQTYVALSRVTTLEGLHLINLDPSSIKASIEAIKEYNRLRAAYRSDLPQIAINYRYWPKEWDTQWAFQEGFVEEQPENRNISNESCITGFHNENGVSSYANATIQCIFHSSVLRHSLSSIPNKESDVMNILLSKYMESSQALSIAPLIEFIGVQSFFNGENDPVNFIEELFDKIPVLKNHSTFGLRHVDRCTICNYTKNSTDNGFIISLSLNNLKTAVELNDLITRSFDHWVDVNETCDNCGKVTKTLRKTTINSTAEVIIVKLEIFLSNTRKVKEKTKIWKLKGIPRTTVSFSNNVYSVKSAILHCSTSANNHYTSLLRGQNSEWINIDDARITKTRWPRNSKDVYLLFLEKKK